MNLTLDRSQDRSQLAYFVWTVGLTKVSDEASVIPTPRFLFYLRPIEQIVSSRETLPA